MKVFKILSVALIATIFGAGALFAQVQQQAPQMPDFPTSADVSDDEVEKLVNAILDLGPVQEKTQERMAEVVEAEDLSFDRFQQLMSAMQNPQMADQVDVSDEEMVILQNIQPKLMEIQGDAETEMISKIEENGLTAERYQLIIMGAQQDPELLARVETMLDEKEEN